MATERDGKQRSLVTHVIFLQPRGNLVGQLRPSALQPTARPGPEQPAHPMQLPQEGVAHIEEQRQDVRHVRRVAREAERQGVQESTFGRLLNLRAPLECEW